MSFIPETPDNSIEDVPYYDDVGSNDGWQGHQTTKSLERLKEEVTKSIARLGGMVMAFQKGTFQVGKHKREGFRINYVVEVPSGQMLPGQLDIAALPVKETYRNRATLKKRKERSLKMSLYMLEIAMSGAWFLQQLSPGYAGLMPWMLAENGKTVTELWNNSMLALPPGEDFVEAEVEED